MSFITMTMLSRAVGVLSKQLFNSQLTAEHAQLAGELNQILHVVMVFSEALIKRVFTEKLSFFFQIRPAPGEAEPVRLFHEVVVGFARCEQSLVKTRCHPWVALEDFFF